MGCMVLDSTVLADKFGGEGQSSSAGVQVQEFNSQSSSSGV